MNVHSVVAWYPGLGSARTPCGQRRVGEHGQEPGRAGFPLRNGQVLLRPAGPGHVDVGGQNLAAAGRDHLGIGHALPGGSDDEQGGPAGPAKHASEAPSVEFDGLQDHAALGDAHAPLVGHVGVPDGVLLVSTDAVRDAIAQVGPDASAGQGAVGVDVKGHEVVAGRRSATIRVELSAVTVIPLGNAMSSATRRTEPSAATMNTKPGRNSSPATGLKPARLT